MSSVFLCSLPYFVVVAESGAHQLDRLSNCVRREHLVSSVSASGSWNCRNTMMPEFLHECKGITIQVLTFAQQALLPSDPAPQPL